MNVLFTKRLRSLRLAKGFSAARHFAEALGIPENRYTRYERGAAEPDIDTIYEICRTLAVTPNELFGVGNTTEAIGFASETQADWGGQPLESRRPADPKPMHFAQPERASPSPASDVAAGGATSEDRSAIAWQLAEQIARARISASGDAQPPLAHWAETARWYTDLAGKSPFDAIARLVTDPAIAALPAPQTAALSKLIDVYIDQLRGNA